MRHVQLMFICRLFQAIFELYKSEEDLIEDLHMVKTVSDSGSILHVWLMFS